jgi:hypothetical protein
MTKKDIKKRQEARSREAHGWTALRAEVERREGEARRELKYAQSVEAKNCEAYQRGKIAALTDLANWIADTKEVPPIVSSSAATPGERSTDVR